MRRTDNNIIYPPKEIIMIMKIVFLVRLLFRETDSIFE